MRRLALLSTLLIGVLLAPQGAAVLTNDWTPDWSVDLGEGYITTSPVVDEHHVYVRTSGFWTDVDRPEVKAFTHEGMSVWSYRSDTTTQHDMAPLLLKGAGSGACGSWPDLLLVGWANGDFSALHRGNGTLAWTVSTPVDGWGITGAPLLDGDHVVVPTRTGLTRLCLANGEVDFAVNLSLGWRNGVTFAEDHYWTGSETGHLWKVDKTGSVASSINLSGQLRHAPVLVGERLLLHVQKATSSTIQTYDLTTAELTDIEVSGGSPALPLPVGDTVVFGDNEGLTSVRCDAACAVVDQMPTKVNGEMAIISPSTFYAPVNAPGEGWVVAQLNASGWFSDTTTFSTPHDGYGTSSPAATDTWLFLGNDAGVLMAYSSAPPTDDSGAEEDQSSEPLLELFVFSSALVGMAWLAQRGRVTDAWRVFSLSVLVVAILMLPDVSKTWTSAFDDEQDATTSWNDDWPEAWLGTQIVVFEFPGEHRVVGGLLGHQNVWSLTQEAAELDGLSLSTEATGIGLYVVAINETEGSGWEYFLNDARGTLAVDEAVIDSTVVVRWSLA